MVDLNLSIYQPIDNCKLLLLDAISGISDRLKLTHLSRSRLRDGSSSPVVSGPRDFYPKDLVIRREVENNETAGRIRFPETIVVVPSISRFFFRNE